MDYYEKKKKSRNATDLNEVMHKKVVPEINIKSFFSDQLAGDHITPLSKNNLLEVQVKSSFLGPKLLMEIPYATKAEEFALKRVRRKLKNKISAQESRKRKKQHLENLEKRVRLLDSENASLRKKLEKQDQSLRSLTFQLGKHTSTGGREETTVSYQNQGTQTGICLKCYLQKQPVKDGPGDFKVQTGKNGRIIVQSDFMEKNQTRLCSTRSEYTDFNSILHARSLRDRA